MKKGKLNITPEQMAVYRATAQRRHQEELQELALRQQCGWEVARQGARLLKEKFGAKRVVLFGSLLDLKRMHQRSDVDLAVWGLDERYYFRAVAGLLDIDPTFSVDLVEVEHARPHILEAINTTGVEL